MKSKNFKIENSEVIQHLEQKDGIVPFLESQLLMRNSLPEEQLEMRLKKVGKFSLELKK